MKPQKVLGTIFLFSADGLRGSLKIDLSLKNIPNNLIYLGKSPLKFSESHYYLRFQGCSENDKIHLYHNYHDKYYFFRNCYVWLTLSLKLLWATFYTFDNKNNLNYHDIMKLPLCQRKGLEINYFYVYFSLTFAITFSLMTYFLRRFFFFRFSFFYFRFWLGARKNVSL